MTGFKALLKSFLDFLERKFPDRFEVNLNEYYALKAKVDSLERTFPEARIKAIETEINKFNASLGFIGKVKAGVGGPFER